MKGLRIFFSVLFVFIGTLHFTHEKEARRMIPPFLPFRKAAVLLTGVFEYVFAILFWVQKVQKLTGKLAALFMVLVFPANVYSAIRYNQKKRKNKRIAMMLWLRLPLQIPLILGALAVTHPAKKQEESNRHE